MPTADPRTRTAPHGDPFRPPKAAAGIVCTWETDTRADVVFSLADAAAADDAAAIADNVLDVADSGADVNQSRGIWRGDSEHAYRYSIIGPAAPFLAQEIAHELIGLTDCQAVQIESWIAGHYAAGEYRAAA